MFRTIQGNLLPSCNSYEGAVGVWEEAHVAPKFGGWRGLRDRRDSSKLVIKQGETVRFRYHHTDLVVWEPGRLRVQCWDTASSIVFANQFLPPDVYAESVKGEMCLVTREGTFSKAQGAIQLYLTDEGWTVNDTTVDGHVEYKLNRSVAAEVRQVVKPWMEWRQAMRRIGALPMYPRGRNAYSFFVEMKELLHRRDINESHYQSLAKVCPYDDDETLMPTVYILGGAVAKQIAPFGEIPKKSHYQHSPAWTYI